MKNVCVVFICTSLIVMFNKVVFSRILQRQIFSPMLIKWEIKNHPASRFWGPYIFFQFYCRHLNSYKKQISISTWKIKWSGNSDPHYHQANISGALEILPPSDFLSTRTHHSLLFHRVPASLTQITWLVPKGTDFTIPALN